MLGGSAIPASSSLHGGQDLDVSTLRQSEGGPLGTPHDLAVDRDCHPPRVSLQAEAKQSTEDGVSRRQLAGPAIKQDHVLTPLAVRPWPARRTVSPRRSAPGRMPQADHAPT